MTSKRHRPWHRRLAKKWAFTAPQFCEVRFKGCWGTYGLSPAHSKDRDEIYTEAEFAECVAACEWCHKILDHEMSKEDRRVKVKEIIANRDEYVSA